MLTIKVSQRSLEITFLSQIYVKRTCSFPMRAGPAALCISAGISTESAVSPLFIAPIAKAVSSRGGGSSRSLFNGSWGKFIIASLLGSDSATHRNVVSIKSLRRILPLPATGLKSWNVLVAAKKALLLLLSHKAQFSHAFLTRQIIFHLTNPALDFREL